MWVVRTLVRIVLWRLITRGVALVLLCGGLLLLATVALADQQTLSKLQSLRIQIEQELKGRALKWGGSL